MTQRQALEKYCAIVNPQAHVSNLPIWMAGLIARLTGAKELQAQLPFFKYTARAQEAGDNRETNQILGAATTTVEQWSKQQIAK